MLRYLFLILIFTQAFAAQKPYNDVVAELVPKGCEQKKENIFLSKIQRAAIEKLSETKLYGGLALRFITTCPDGSKKYHYVDSHIVRTLNETVVVTIESDKVKSFIVSSFNEPPEYKAPQKWYKQFNGKSSGEVLRVSEQIDGLSGATLTVNSSVSAVNKVLALHKTLKKL